MLVGLSTIGNVHGYVLNEGEKQPIEGQLFYRGINVEDIVANCEREQRFGFEETAYLLLFGSLPTREQLTEWESVLAEYRRAPQLTRERMYLDAMRDVYSGANKIIVDARAGSLMYLPLEQLMAQRGAATAASQAASTPQTAAAAPQPEVGARSREGERSRSREVR
ncbi:MAG: hypothetical protein J6T92_00960 [Ottowia sp.]|nr:hypothetical protein [Ottowia sp.]